MADYVVYLTIYRGEKHPKFYIGSTSKAKYNDGYMGSVCSRKWKDIFYQERELHPEQYDCIILDEFDCRIKALEVERNYHINHSVIDSPEFMNEAIASKNGFFGRDVSGKSNPRYGDKCTDITKNRLKESNSNLVSVSVDNGETWYRVTTEEYHNNKNNYITPRGDMNPVVFEKTRERVRNGTHHFCDPEVQKRIHDKRRGNIFVTEQNKQIISNFQKDRMRKWENRLFQGTEYMWLRCVELYSVYKTSNTNVYGYTKHIKQKWVERFPDMSAKNKWMGKLITKFNTGWNPLEDNEYMDWRESHD